MAIELKKIITRLKVIATNKKQYIYMRYFNTSSNKIMTNNGNK